MLFSSLLRNWNRSAAAHRRGKTSDRQRDGLAPLLESLEGRCLLSTLTVTNTLDSGAGSLRNAIAAAQNGDTIVFASTLSSSATLSSTSTLSNSTTLFGSSTKSDSG